MKSASQPTALAPHDVGFFMIAFFQALCGSHGTQPHFALPVLSEFNLLPPNKWSQSQDCFITALVENSNDFGDIITEFYHKMGLSLPLMGQEGILTPM